MPEASPDPVPAAGAGRAQAPEPAGPEHWPGPDLRLDSGLPLPPDLRVDGLRLGPPGGRVTVRRTWLDTFDWRLYRAGLTLEQVSQAGGAAELRLTGRDGALITAEPLAAGPGGRLPEWPVQIAGLPAGPWPSSWPA